MGDGSKVLLLNPPFLPKFSRSQRSPGVIKSGTLYYPIWLAYATGVLEKAGHETLLVDAPASDLNRDQVRDLVREFEPDLVVIDTSTPSINNDIEVLRDLKSSFPNAVYVLVGTHVSALAREILEENPEVDGACRAEYDYTLRDLADALARGGSGEGVAGLLWRSGEAVSEGPERPWIDPLDDLPWVSQVYQRYLPIESYFYSITRCPVITLIAGRGCPYRCRFCVYPQTMHGHRYRRRNPADVVEEMAWIEQHMPHVKEIFFEDDTLTADKGRVMEMCSLIVERGLRIPWTANSRADVDLETLRTMKRANCRLLCVGVESGVQEILDRMGKKITLGQIEQYARDARSAGIMVHGCFLVGCEGETAQTMEETFQFAKRLKFDTAQFFPLMVYPGTAAFEWAKSAGFLLTEEFNRWIDEEGCHNCVVSRPGLSSEDLVIFCDQARRRYYLRPAYMFSKAWQVVTRPGELRRVARASRTFFRYLATRR